MKVKKTEKQTKRSKITTTFFLKGPTVSGYISTSCSNLGNRCLACRVFFFTCLKPIWPLNPNWPELYYHGTIYGLWGICLRCPCMLSNQFDLVELHRCCTLRWWLVIRYFVFCEFEHSIAQPPFGILRSVNQKLCISTRCLRGSSHKIKLPLRYSKRLYSYPIGQSKIIIDLACAPDWSIDLSCVHDLSIDLSSICHAYPPANRCDTDGN